MTQRRKSFPPFYAAHNVDELVTIDPDARTVKWLALDAGEYRSVERSTVIEMSAETLALSLAWPD